MPKCFSADGVTYVKAPEAGDLLDPELFGRHVAERGHVIIKPSRATASSVRFATALVRLERAGVVRSRQGPATGAWDYPGQVTH